jgi:hypothetical protein
MKLSSLALLLALFPCTATAFSPSLSSTPKAAVTSTSGARGAVLVSDGDGDGRPSKPIYDPMGLYPKNSFERQNGWIQPLESSSTASTMDEQKDYTVIDPLSIYPRTTDQTTEIIMDMKDWMSPSLPFAKRPSLLDGSLPGDRGFDPFNFASTPEALDFYRTAEIKHARLAMLAAIGWPVSELVHDTVAKSLGWTSLLVAHGDRVPSVLNGGLSDVNPAFWVAALGAAVILETVGSSSAQNNDNNNYNNPTGDFGFDPLQLFGGNDKTEEQKFVLQESELFNGRLGMLAITGFAMQEFWTQFSVVHPHLPVF